MAVGSDNAFPTNAVWHYVDYHTLVSMTLPSSLTTIESSAFSGTAARVIIIPSTVTSVASDAFDSCPDLVYIVNRSGVAITPPAGVEVITE